MNLSAEGSFFKKNTIFPLSTVLFPVFLVTCFQGHLKILNGGPQKQTLHRY